MLYCRIYLRLLPRALFLRCRSKDICTPSRSTLFSVKRCNVVCACKDRQTSASSFATAN
jgi:hypothetical protein